MTVKILSIRFDCAKGVTCIQMGQNSCRRGEEYTRNSCLVLSCCMEGSVPRILVLPNCQNRKETRIKAGNLAGKRSYVSVFWFSTKYLFQATHTQSAIKPAHKLGETWSGW